MHGLLNCQYCQRLKFYRCLQLKKEVKCAKLHTFVDVSQEAYGAAVYIKVEYQDESLSVCLVAQTKVAPLHSINALSMETKSITFWTDSANVLWWI